MNVYLLCVSINVCMGVARHAWVYACVFTCKYKYVYILTNMHDACMYVSMYIFVCVARHV